jgi:hypothetical protein
MECDSYLYNKIVPKGGQADTNMVTIKSVKCYFVPNDGMNAHYQVCRRFDDIQASNCRKSTLRVGKYFCKYEEGVVEVLYFNNSKKALQMFKNHFPLRRVIKWFTAMGITKKDQNTLLLKISIHRISLELGFSAY